MKTKTKTIITALTAGFLIAASALSFTGCSNAQEKVSNSNETETASVDMVSSTVSYELKTAKDEIRLHLQGDVNADLILAAVTGYGQGCSLPYDASLSTDNAGYDNEIIFDLRVKHWDNASMIEALELELQNIIANQTAMTSSWRSTRFCPVIVQKNEKSYSAYILYSSLLDDTGGVISGE